MSRPSGREKIDAHARLFFSTLRLITRLILDLTAERERFARVAFAAASRIKLTSSMTLSERILEQIEGRQLHSAASALLSVAPTFAVVKYNTAFSEASQTLTCRERGKRDARLYRLARRIVNTNGDQISPFVAHPDLLAVFQINSLRIVNAPCYAVLRPARLPGR